MLKKNLGVVSLLLACSLFLFSACGKPAQSQTPSSALLTPPLGTPEPIPSAFIAPFPEPALDVEGFEKYAGNGFVIQYPDTWLAADEKSVSALDSEEWQQAIAEAFGEDIIEDIRSHLSRIDFSTILVQWLDTEDSMEDGLMNNASIGVESNGMLTMVDLSNEQTARTFGEGILEGVTRVIPNVELISDIESKKLGNNDFLVFSYTASDGEAEISFYQACAINDTNLYAFTVAVAKGELDIPLYEKMLATLEFVE